MIILYLLLLAAGVTLFALSYAALFKLAAILRQRYPQHWQVIVEADHGKASAWRTWVRMQQVVRSPALTVLGYVSINRWISIWRYSPWLGWLCWLAALSMRLMLH